MLSGYILEVIFKSSVYTAAKLDSRADLENWFAAYLHQNWFTEKIDRLQSE